MSWLDSVKDSIALVASAAAVAGTLFAILRDYNKTRVDRESATMTAAHDMVELFNKMRDADSDDQEAFRRVTLDAYVAAMKTIAELQASLSVVQKDCATTGQQLASVTQQLTAITLERDEYRRQVDQERDARMAIMARLEHETTQRESLAQLLTVERGERQRLEQDLAIARAEIDSLRGELSKLRQGDTHGA